ncbi:MULE domain-containing protein, partial [Aphis craccivora]
QSLFWKIQNLGLRNEYVKNSEIGIWLKSFFCFAFLPCTEVSDAFGDLMSIAPEDQKILKCSDYVL